jgi:hypothetical protein
LKCTATLRSPAWPESLFIAITWLLQSLPN